jgi:hypothetical protein
VRTAIPSDVERLGERTVDLNVVDPRPIPPDLDSGKCIGHRKRRDFASHHPKRTLGRVTERLHQSPPRVDTAEGAHAHLHAGSRWRCRQRSPFGESEEPRADASTRKLESNPAEEIDLERVVVHAERQIPDDDSGGIDQHDGSETRHPRRHPKRVPDLRCRDPRNADLRDANVVDHRRDRLGVVGRPRANAQPFGRVVELAGRRHPATIPSGFLAQCRVGQAETVKTSPCHHAGRR